MPRAAVGLLVLLGVLGCRGRSATDIGSAPAPRPRGALALVAPRGGTPVDALLQGLQGRVRRAPEKLDSWIALGRAWVRKARESADPGYYRSAESAARAALEIAPGSPLALDLLGLVLLSDHRFAEARALALEVIARRPDDAPALGNLSDAALELGRFEEAAQAAQRMVELKPNLPSYARAAYLRWLQGDGRAAKGILRLAIDAAADTRDPEPRAWAIVQAALLFWHEGDGEGAEAGFDAALSAFPEYPPALAGKARVLLARGEGRRAAALAERAYAKSPLLEHAWLLGDARAAVGDLAGAHAAYDILVRQGERTDPRTLALYYATTGQNAAEAVRLASAELRVRGDIYTQDALAFALYRAGRLAEARAASDAALRLGTRDARLLYHAGAIRLAQGELEAGRRLLADALALNPGFDPAGAAEARRLLGAGSG